MYLLDTNHCSRAILGDTNILRRLAEVENALVTTCVIVQGELIDMAERSKHLFRVGYFYSISTKIRGFQTYRGF